MRFLIGLLTGAALVLALMQSVALGPKKLLDEAERIWSAFEAYSARVASAPTDDAPRHVPEIVSSPPPARIEAPVERLVPAAALDDLFSSSQERGEPPMAMEKRGTQAVWAPFHSQRSAEGFAQSLTDALARPFDVRREGPRHYEVLFSYADEQERQDVLRAMAERTGAAL